MNAKIDINKERQKSWDVKHLLDQMAELEETIINRDRTAESKNFIGGISEKNMWDAETQTMRSALQILKDKHALEILKWAQQLN